MLTCHRTYFCRAFQAMTFGTSATPRCTRQRPFSLRATAAGSSWPRQHRRCAETVGLVLREGRLESPLLHGGPTRLEHTEKDEDQERERPEHWENRTQASDKLAKVHRMPHQTVGARNHEATRFRGDAEAPTETQCRVDGEP